METQKIICNGDGSGEDKYFPLYLERNPSLS